MAFQYRIHPAIGIARLGDAPPGTYFIGPEKPGFPPTGGAPGTTVPPYKDGGLIKPQAARFRVWAYKRVAGVWTPDHEVIAGSAASEVASIEWKVHLANRKAEFFKFDGLTGETAPGSSTMTRRNSAVTPRSRLVIDPGPRTISGRSATPRTFSPTGAAGELWPVDTAGTRVIDYLGQLRTDPDGQLIVIGGKGRSASSAIPPRPLGNFANNEGWFDDVSDGPVTAEIRFGGPGAGAPVQAVPAWVLVGPPDFAPELEPVVTLYDLLFDMAARNLTLPTDEALLRGPLKHLATLNNEMKVHSRLHLTGFKPEFFRDVYPLLTRAVNAGWVFGPAANQHVTVGENSPGLLPFLSTPPPAGGADSNRGLRQSVLGALRPPPGYPPATGNGRMPKLLGDDSLSGASFLTVTPTQYAILERWAAGKFTRAGSSPPSTTGPGPAISPQGLDQAALERCVGGAFVPGIEVGWQIRAPGLFAAPFRIKHGAPSAHRADPPGTLVAPGHFSRQMAVPWQADFLQCAVENRAPVPGAPPEKFGWWPQQRPVDVRPAAAAAPVRWSRPNSSFSGGSAPSRKEMVQHWSKFGFVLRDPSGFLEKERSPGLP